jgi:hypothetical protein
MEQKLKRLTEIRKELSNMEGVDLAATIDYLDEAIYEVKIEVYGYDPDCPDSVEKHRIDIKEDYEEE